MRRFRIGVLLISVLSLLFVPGKPALASDVEVDRLEAFVIGDTNPPDDPHSLGINRVAGPSAFRGLEIDAVIDCGDEIVVAPLSSTLAHEVEFESDDDVTDGFGEVHATDETRQFRGSGVETRIGPPPSPSTSTVEIRILGGRFHRILNYVEVTLRLDIRVERADEGLVCEDADHEIRIVFLIVGPSRSGTTGFSLVGVARTHEPGEIELARTICGAVSPHSTRVSEPLPTDPTTPISPGRGAFHPCPPEGQN